ncbi:hypothetical protein KY366_00330 [Candidatus Woesearchaeota archaeon]|nr:hypothetical protein [Candidatus Woesearchaeota archaeon]
MFNFLKRFFSSPEEEKTGKEVIKADELGDWFKYKSSVIFTDLDRRVEVINSRLKDAVMRTKDNLAILSTSKLYNPKVSVKENQYMEGNRKSYILGVNNFLRGIDLNKKDYPSLLDFCNDFSLRLDRFGKSTFRSYQILQEFFSHESRNIAMGIKDIENSVKQLGESVKNARIGKVEEIKKDIAALGMKLNQKSGIESSSKDKEKVKEGLLKNKKDIEKKINDLVKSREYKKLNHLKADKEVLLANIREHNARMIHAFSVMERPLRKLQKMVIEDSGLLQKYIENPVDSLVNDDELKIAGLLRKLEKNINNYTLDLKDKKREKVLETVKCLTEEFLREFVNRHNELNAQLDSLEKEVSGSETLRKENSLNYELSSIQGNLEKLDSEILSNRHELDKIDLRSMKNSLGNKINELLNSNIFIA